MYLVLGTWYFKRQVLVLQPVAEAQFGGTVQKKVCIQYQHTRWKGQYVSTATSWLMSFSCVLLCIETSEMRWVWRRAKNDHRGWERDVYHTSVKSLTVFQSFTILHLTKPIRTADDPEWTTVCDNLGNGMTEPAIPDEDGGWTSVGLSTWVDLPDTIKCYDAETQINDARDWAHPDVKDKYERCSNCVCFGCCYV